MNLFADRVHRVPRVWSNQELSKFAHLFHGDIVNVSGWKDIDKEGRFYKDYFANAQTYTVTNYRSDARGFQGQEGEIFLDLEETLPEDLDGRFDVVFNHTTLEHIYDVNTAFRNLCGMTKDIAIVVVPFLQQYHAEYGDYWRFTPLAMKRLFEDQGMEVLYQSFNSHKRSSVYLFSIAAKRPENWRNLFEGSLDHVDPYGKGPEPFVGCHAIPNISYKLRRAAGQISSFLLRIVSGTNRR